MKIKLDVPLFKQKKNDMACGFICLQMVLAYYQKVLSYDEIKKITKLDPDMGCWWAQMACAALDLGFKTEFLNYNMDNIYDKDIIGLNGKKLIEKLKIQKEKINQKYHPEIDYDIEMIQKGGKLNLSIPQKEDLIGWLKQGIPPILSVKVGSLYGHAVKNKKTHGQHSIVVYGYDGKDFLVHDPNPEKDRVEKISEDILMYSWHRGKAVTLLIER